MAHKKQAEVHITDATQILNIEESRLTVDNLSKPEALSCVSLALAFIRDTMSESDEIIPCSPKSMAMSPFDAVDQKNDVLSVFNNPTQHNILQHEQTCFYKMKPFTPFSSTPCAAVTQGSLVMIWCVQCTV